MTKQAIRALELLVKEGLRTYKMNNSKAVLPQLVAAKKQDKLHKKGAVFAVRKKEDFTANGVKGFIIRSREALFEYYNQITHFTPNELNTFGYADEHKKYIKGHSEKNLLQINTFFIDIDTKEHTVQDILMYSIKDTMGAPTLILESPSGYQCHWILDAPAFISNKNDYKSLKIAKRIADNLKQALQTVDADLCCNSFGFCRVPNDQNIRFFEENRTYTFGEMLDWSKAVDAGKRALFVVPKPVSIADCVQADWFVALAQVTDVRGHKGGKLGRNNLLFTLALGCYADGMDEQAALSLINQINANFKTALSANEISTIVSSAYSGAYKGPCKSYINALLNAYVANAQDIQVKVATAGNKKWYKHIKARVDRVRSHLHEREADVLEYLADNGGAVRMTQKELCAALDIASSSLNKLLKVSKKIVARRVGTGRNAFTMFMTTEAFIKNAIKRALDKKQEFTTALRELVEQACIRPATAAKEHIAQYVDALTSQRKQVDYNLFTDVNTS